MEIHPEAAHRFNERAELLANRLSNRPVPRNPRARYADRLHVPDQIVVEGALTEEAFDLTDDRGFLVTTDSTGSIRLYADDYIELQRLAETIQKARDFRNAVSVTFVRNRIFDWRKNRLVGGRWFMAHAPCG